MKNISGTLISLTGKTGNLGYSYTGTSIYYAWTAAQVDSVCAAIKNLLVNNVSALSVVSSATNNYILRHTGQETGYALRIYGSGAGSTSSPPYVEIAEGTYSNGAFTRSLYYRIYPFNSGSSNYTSQSSYFGTLTWSWGYYYRLLVDDSGNSFVLGLRADTSVSDPPSYSTSSRPAYTRAVVNNSGSTYLGDKAIVSMSQAPVLFSMLPVDGTYYFTIFSQRYLGGDSRLGATYVVIMTGGVNTLSTSSQGEFGGSPNSPSNIFLGWTIFNRKYVIASTMYPQTQETDYGEIKMVKLGVHEYGLPYIVDGVYVDNFFACERNSNLVNNQIVEIDGYKYLYCDSGYLFRLGPAPVPLATPTISLTGDTLTITAVPNATSYKVYSDGILATTVQTTTVDLSSLQLAAGTHSVTVRASASGYLDSDASTAVSYTAE